MIEGDIWNNSAQRALTYFINSARQIALGVIYTAGTNLIITNTTAETSVFTTATSVGALLLPPNFMAPGKQLRVQGIGVYSTPVTPGSVQIKVKLGGSTLATVTTTAFLNSASNSAFEFRQIILCETSGSTGKFSTGGNINYQGQLGLNTVRAFDDIDNDGAPITVNSTTDLLIDITAKWDTADTAKVANVVASSVEVLN